MDTLQHHSLLIKKIAHVLGFDHCGIAKAQPLDEDARRLEKWLQNGFHAGMKYMERHFELRVNPLKLVSNARSVITLMKNYFPEKEQQPGTPRISKYAFGKDYHEVIREKLDQFLHRIREEAGDIHGRGFVDSAPVLERTWAQRSGLGWVGKNGNLINKQTGSFFFIATLITDLELQPDDPFVKDFCGTCTKCIDACPTQAILPGQVIDSNRCISYLTIELKDMVIPSAMNGKSDNWMFGCDTCQDVCSWNRFSRPHAEKAFDPIPEILNLSTSEWEQMKEETFRQIFKHSPLKRAKFSGIQRNLRFLRSNDPA